MTDRCRPAQALFSRRSMVMGGLGLLAALGTQHAKAVADSRLLMWPAFIYGGLRHAALSVYVMGDGAKNRGGYNVEGPASEFLGNRLRTLSIDTVSYGDLLKQVGSAVDIDTLVIFCNVQLRSWPLGADVPDLVVGGVTLQFQRAAQSWQNQSEHVGLFASRSGEPALSDAILKAVTAHLDQALVAPLTALVK